MDLANPLTKYRLDRLRPLPLVKDFSWADVALGSMSLGICPSGHLVDKTVIEIKTAFNGGVQMTVGDVVAQGRLMVIADNKPNVANHYEVNNSFEYVADTEIFIFFPGGIPTIGIGRVIVYLR